MDSYTSTRRRRERRRRIIGSIVAVIAALALIIMTVAPTFAAASGFTRYHASATANPDGSVDVVLDLEYRFDGEENHGIYLTYLTRQRIEDDPDQYRVLEYSDITATSPGAPADVDVVDADDGIGIYIGDEDVHVGGTQEYTVSFTVDGVVNPGAGADGEDEIYWNIIGTGFDDVIDDVDITLHGPADVLDVGCWFGPQGADAECTGASAQGSEAHFDNTLLMPGEGLTIAASYEAGTFSGVTPIFVKRSTFTNTMGGWATGAGAVLLAAVGAVLGRRGVGFFRRDEQFEHTTPGLIPPAGTGVGRAPRKVDPAVQFTPPPGLVPFEVGLVTEGRFLPGFAAATVVDLAVRGYLHITSTGEEKRKSNWELTRLHEETSGLSDYERELLEALFTGVDTVNFDSLPATTGQRMAALARQQSSQVATKGWFVNPPDRARAATIGIGGALVGLGAVLTTVLAFAGVGLLGLPVIVTGIAVALSGWKAKKRTALGRAHYVQALGFKKYLETAEAGQLRFEAGEDIFSKYLPYAMVFGVVEPWIAAFEELADRGEWSPVTAWYTGTLAGAYWFANPADRQAFTSNVAGAQAVAALSGMTAATAGSSGQSAFTGSGFSGGGFSGGGVGGGGGGSW